MRPLASKMVPTLCARTAHTAHAPKMGIEERIVRQDFDRTMTSMPSLRSRQSMQPQTVIVPAIGVALEMEDRFFVSRGGYCEQTSAGLHGNAMTAHIKRL